MANVLGQGRGVVDKAEGGLEGRADRAKAVGRGQDCGGVAKSVGAWPSAWGGRPKPWERGQGVLGVVKTVGAKPRLKSRRR